MVIGLTGAYCAGKNAVADILESRGFDVIDEDKIGHEALRACRDEIVAAFGDDVIDEHGEVSRRDLGRIAFASPESLARLESIVHPWMVSETERRLTAERSVINAAILYHMGLDRLCDSVMVVRACVLLRIVRCKRRDGLPLKQIVARIRSQRGLNTSSKGVDTHSVWNIGGRRGLERRVYRVLKRMSR